MADFDARAPADLRRRAGGMAKAPDPPIWMDAGIVASGALRETVVRFIGLPGSHQAYHYIRIVGGQILEAAAIREAIDERDDEGAPTGVGNDTAEGRSKIG